MSHAEKARDLFRQGYNCSQSVFAAFCDVTGLTESQALKVSASFGGGIGRMRDVCGALSGGFMVLGCVFSDGTTNETNKADLYARVQRVASSFREQCGSILCRDLLSSPSSAPQPTPRTADFYKSRPCAAFVEKAANLIDDELAR